MKPFYTAIFLVCFTFLNTLCAQDPASINYTTKDGLISNNVYHIMQDTKGYLWFSTDKGVSRFNGSEFKNYGLNEGLDGEDVFLTKEDKDGNIWICGISGKIWTYSNDSVLTYQYNDSLEKYYGNNTIFKSIQRNRNGDMIFGTIKKGCILIDTSGNVSEFNVGSGKIIEINENKAFLYSLRSMNPPYANSVGIAIYENKVCAESQGNNEDIKIKRKPNFYCKYSEIDSIWYISSHNHLYTYKKKSLNLIKVYSETIDCIYVNKKGIIFIGFLGGGMLRTQIVANKILFEDKFLKKLSVTSISQNFNGEYLISTLEQGVFKFWNLNTLKFENQRLKISDFKIVGNDTIYMSFSNGTLYRLIKGKFEIKKIFGSDELRSDKAIFFESSDSSTFILSDKVIQNSKNTKDVYKSIVLNFSKFNSIPKIILKLQKNRYFITTTNKIFTFDGIELVQNPIDLMSYDNDLRINCLHLLSPTGLLLGTNVGLITIKENEIAKVSYKGISINKIFKTKEGIAIFSRSNFLDVINNSDSLRLNSFDLVNSLDVGYIKNLDLVYLFTNKDLCLLNYKNGRLFKYEQFMNFLPVSDISWFDISDDFIWVMDETSIYQMESKNKSINSLSAIRSNIVSTRVNDSIVFSSGYDPFEISENDIIEFTYGSLGMELNKRSKFEYRLIPSSYSWQKTNSSEVIFRNLSPGSYKFQIRAINENSKTRSRISQISFIVPHYLEPGSWAYFLLYSLAISILTWIKNNYTIQSIKAILKKISRKEEINTLKLQLLQSKMNPHFTFNVLNSIQSFLVSEDKHNTLMFINKYSKFLRKVFVNIDYANVKLAEEIEFLERYVEIENIRLNGKISFNVICGTEIDPRELLIPTMIIQPILENAIKYGFKTGIQEYILELKILMNNNFLEIIVFNSGGGIERSKPKSQGTLSNSLDKNDNHVSKGIAIVKERLAFVNRKQNADNLFELKNVYLSNKIIGVSAKLKLPVIYKKN